MNCFKEKVAIVTGGASGIGQAVCEALGRKGAVVIVSDINTTGAQQVADGIIRNGGKARGSYLDVTSEADIRGLIEQTVEEHGRLDYMFNNAGIAIQGDVRDMNTDHWKRIMDINLMGVLHGTLIAYAQMVEQGFGHIVNTASLLGLVPLATNTPYATTKHAIVGLSTSLRDEGAALGVKVSVICPGQIQSNLFNSATVVNADNNKFYSLVPMKRMDTKKAVKVILNNVKRNKAIIVFPFFARFLWWTYRIYPSYIRKQNMAFMKAFRRRVRKE